MIYMRPMMMKCLCAATALALLGTLNAPLSAHAQESVIQNMLEGAGLTSSRKSDIEYRERAPLVVPPKVGDLPPPKAESAAKADPAWPTDPDVERRRKLDEEDNVPAGQDYKSYLNRNNPWISPTELQQGRREGAGLVTAPDTVNREGRTVVSPEELRKGNPALAAKGGAKAEPARRRLTDPPVGYRTQVPQAPSPEGASVEPEKKPGFFSRLNPFGK
jgi:hypothetical protein